MKDVIIFLLSLCLQLLSLFIMFVYPDLFVSNFATKRLDYDLFVVFACLLNVRSWQNLKFRICLFILDFTFRGVVLKCRLSLKNQQVSISLKTTREVVIYTIYWTMCTLEGYVLICSH